MLPKGLEPGQPDAKARLLSVSLKGKGKQRGPEDCQDCQLVTTLCPERPRLNSPRRAFPTFPKEAGAFLSASGWLASHPLHMLFLELMIASRPSAPSSQDSQTPQHLPPFGRNSHIESYFLF